MSPPLSQHLVFCAMLSGEPHSLLRSHAMHAGDVIMHQELKRSSKILLS